MDRRINWNLHLAVIATVIALTSGIGLGRSDEGQAAPPADGAQTTKTQTTGTQTAAPADEPAAAEKRTYNSTPESVMQLLSDSKAAVDQITANGRGVHFTGNFTMSVEGVMINARGEGDVIPPDKADYWMELHHPYVSERFGELFDVILFGNNIYLKPYWSQKWAGRTIDPSPYASAKDSFDYTKFVASTEFLGRESVDGGGQVYHVRIQVDAAAVAEVIEKEITSDIDQQTGEDLEKLKASVITNDIWIGVNDLLVYQVTERFSNTELQIAFDDMSLFYGWGKEVSISPPPAENTFFVND